MFWLGFLLVETLGFAANALFGHPVQKTKVMHEAAYVV